MKRFIELTNNVDGLKILLAVDSITGIVCCENGRVFVEMGYDGEGLSSGISVEESYEEVKRMLEAVS